MRLKQKNLLRYYQARRRRDKVEEAKREEKEEGKGRERSDEVEGKHEISAQRMLWQLLPTLPATIAAISKEEKRKGRRREGRGVIEGKGVEKTDGCRGAS